MALVMFQTIWDSVMSQAICKISFDLGYFPEPSKLSLLTDRFVLSFHTYFGSDIQFSTLSIFSELWSSHGIDVRLVDGVCNPCYASQPRPCMALASKASGSFPS